MQRLFGNLAGPFFVIGALLAMGAGDNLLVLTVAIFCLLLGFGCIKLAE